jgi:hypothetical protein
MTEEMNMATDRLERATTPKGVAMYPWLTKPDTKWSVEGVYKMSLSVANDDKEALALCDKIRDLYTDEFGNKKMAKAIMPFKDDGEGNIVFSFKSKKKPNLFNAKGNPVKNTEDLKIGGGSIVKVNCSINPYDKGINTGVALYLNAVQIIELVEFKSKSAFGDEGGSFTDEGSDEDDAPTPKKKATTVDEEEEDSEF